MSLPVSLTRSGYPRIIQFLLKRKIWDKPSLPIDLWLGQGMPLNPYLKGLVINRLREVYKPVV